MTMYFNLWSLHHYNLQTKIRSLSEIFSAIQIMSEGFISQGCQLIYLANFAPEVRFLGGEHNHSDIYLIKNYPFFLDPSRWPLVISLEIN